MRSLDRGVVLIGCGNEAGLIPLVDQIGSKAHGLARMSRLGLPIPPALVIGTAWCRDAAAISPDVWQPALEALERSTGLRFGDARRPLLLSVRSGAPVSMPGMMETLLDIGLNDATVQGLVRSTGNPRLAWDAYRRLVAGFGEVVLGIAPAAFDVDVEQVLDGRAEDELSFDDWRQVTRRHLDTVQRIADQPFPQDPRAQLHAAVRAVFASWWSDKAATYRRLKKIDDAMGTAVTIQKMVFGNGGGASGAGVGFTRHPSTGEPTPWVDFLFNAQGEDVVAGRRNASGHEALAAVAPSIWQALLAAVPQLEREFGDMQDFEFTVEEGRLYLLQTRAGKRTPQAAARIALDLVDEGVIDRAEALRRTEGLDEATLSEARLAPGEGVEGGQLVSGQSACTGVVTGEIALDEARVRDRQAAGAAVVLVRHDAETQDIAALELADGLLTARGARTSHAAVVARQLGKVCIVGCVVLEIDLARRLVRFGERELAEGEVITLDGHAGAVHAGAARVLREAPAGLLRRLARLRAND